MALHCSDMQDTYPVVIDMSRVRPMNEKKSDELEGGMGAVEGEEEGGRPAFVLEVDEGGLGAGGVLGEEVFGALRGNEKGWGLR